MIKLLQNIHPVIFLLIATSLEVSGDAIIRISMERHSGIARMGLMLLGGVLLFGYGYSLNLAPVEFGKVVGLYIATLFVVWQIGSFIAFRTLPNLPVIVGGLLIVTGGLIVTFWKPQ
ncbi:MAG TPA: hypothetical protein VGO58_06770 [Chitinophagaceae bacterium]|jgi:small multidrug resistance family-3 protein|nr:hypothetical protein [Chitinophagaceae bacterium]